MIRYHNLTSTSNSITIKYLNHPKVATEFLIELKKVIRLGYREIEININSKSVFPNAAVPISGIIDYYRNIGFVFTLAGHDTCGILTPKGYDIARDAKILNRIIKFTADDANRLSSVYMSDLRKSDEFPVGLLNALEWSLNEVMDNVIQHAETNYGYIMGQIHPKTKMIAFTVYDSGQGILNSFNQTKLHSPRTAIDAITLAIREEVTSDHTKGQGNGLFGLHSIVSHGKGSLTITSDKGSIMFDGSNGYTKTFDKIPVIDKKHGATTVDFKLNYSQDLSLGDALAFRGVKYQFVNLTIENLEDDLGNIRYSILDMTEGTGTREAAERTFKEIVNIINETKKRVILDFSGVSLFSCSYADQLIAQLLTRFGLFRFNKLIQLNGMNETQEKILQRSVIQRIAREYIQSSNEESYETSNNI